MATGSPRTGKRTPLEAFIYWTAVLAVWGAIFLVGFLAIFAQGLPDTSSLYEAQRRTAVTYLDRNGALIATSGTQSAPPVDIDKLPVYVPGAFIAIEDRRFYHHPGFDPIRMASSLLANARCHCIAAGGSTITQQLARNLFLTPKQNMRDRKSVV